MAYSTTLDSKKSIGQIFFECLIACALIFSCDTMYITLAPHDLLYRNIALAVIVAGAVGIMITSGGLKDRSRVKTGFLYTAVIAAWLLIYILVTFFNKGSFLKLAVGLGALLLYYFIAEGAGKIPAVLLRYEQIMVVIAAFSILCWLVFSIFRLLPSTGVELTWWNGTDHNTEVTSYYGIYFEPQSKLLFGTRLIRNCGFFVEAPIASLHFSFAFLINLFLRKQTSVFKSVILIVAILTTFSATGCVVIAAGLVARLLISLFSSKRYKGMQVTGRVFILLLVIFILAALIVICLLIVRNRIGGISWRIRMEDYTAAFGAWLDKPVFGNGLYNFDAVKAHFEGARALEAGFSSSNSIGTILADGGLMFGILYVGAFLLALIRAVKNKEPGMFCFSLFVFVIFCVTIVAYDYLILMMFIFMGAYKCRGARKLNAVRKEPKIFEI